MKKILKHLYNYRYIYLICLVVFISLIYTHSNTFLANDDLPYMFLYRTNERVNSLADVIKNQYVDYFNINGRVLVHSVLQLVLIFDKKLWVVINPLMIVATILLLNKIVKNKNKEVNEIINILLGITLYLTLFNYKNIIYWVAGSINYIWVSVLLYIILYLYYKYGYCKKKYVNMLIIFILCAMHECTMVFTIIFIITEMIYSYIKDKKFNKDYIYYLLSLSGSLVLFLSPSNQARLVSDIAWNSLNIIEKFSLSIPAISKDILNLLDYKYILSYVFIIDILLLLGKINNKYSKIISLLIILNSLIIWIYPSGWLYFILVILLVIGEYYYHYLFKNKDMFILSLSTYAIVYSNIISPTYDAGRPNYYFYMYIILLSMYVINEYILNRNIDKIRIGIYIILSITGCGLLINEIKVYREIGTYHKERLVQINSYIKDRNNNMDNNVLVLTKIPEEYEYYHMDINLPDNDWFTYKSFIYYYGLSEDTIIEYE